MSPLIGVILLAGATGSIDCGGGPAAFLGARDTEIRDATHAIETARDDVRRARAYSTRGAAYSEKARYSRIQKLIRDDEYERLFDLAIRNHDRAISLDPTSADAYFNRGQAYYDRGSLDLIYLTNPFDNKPRNNKWLHAAALDFESASEKNPKDSLTFDRLGLAYESNNETDQAILAYTHEMVLDSRLAKHRLGDMYCVVGYGQELQRDWDAAVAAYQKSVEFGGADNQTCPIEPFEEMIAIYTTESRQYDKAWEMIRQARKAGRRIRSELIQRLTKDSARPN